MAEDEIIKHTKKSFAILNAADKTWFQKLKEIIIEIAIIVFAVTVSIGLHNWSADRQNSKEEKEFLLGLSKDLETDILHMSSSKAFYEDNLKGINYFLGIADGMVLSKDSLNKYAGIFFNSTDLDPHIARYEGFKSSGKFSIIRNKDLLNNIIALHESSIQRIQKLNEKHYRKTEKLEELISQHIQLAPNGELINAADILHRSDFKMLLNNNKGLIANNIIPAHQAGMDRCNEIIRQIGGELD